MVLNSAGGILARPTSIRVPTIFRTIYRKKPSASMLKIIKLSLFSINSADITLRSVTTNPGEQAPPLGSDVTAGFAADDALILGA